MALIVLILALLLTSISAVICGVYTAVPLAELKRQSSRGDKEARMLYQVSRHGVAAQVFLKIVTLATLSVATFIMAHIIPTLTSIPATFALLVVVFFVLPKADKKIARKTALLAAPYLAYLLVRLRPVTDRVAAIIRRYYSPVSHSGIYEKEDLVELLASQKNQTHSRIEKTELDLALSALSFGDKVVKDYMVPRKVVHFVRAEEPVGPVLMSELHDSGFSRFPVRKDGQDDIVGTLYLKDLVEKRTHGIVGNVMSPDVFYVQETDTLEKVLGSFLKTKHHLFIVHDEFAQLVGIITIEDVLEQILGRRIVDESDVHEDMREVAAKQATASE